MPSNGLPGKMLKASCSRSCEGSMARAWLKRLRPWRHLAAGHRLGFHKTRADDSDGTLREYSSISMSHLTFIGRMQSDLGDSREPSAKWSANIWSGMPLA